MFYPKKPHGFGRVISHISSYLVQLGYQEGFLGLSAEILTVAILIAATLIGTATALINSSPAYSLVMVWAFYGIYSRHTSLFEWNFQYPSIILATQVLMVVLALVSVGAGAGVRWLRGSALNSRERA